MYALDDLLSLRRRTDAIKISFLIYPTQNVVALLCI